MSGNFLQRSRHETTYFFRRRVPFDLQLVVGHHQLYKSLATACHRTAIIRARLLASKTDHYFHLLRMGKNKDDSLRLDWVLSYDMGELGVLKIETAPHDTEEEKSMALAAFKTTAQAAIEARAGSVDSAKATGPKANGKTFQAAIDDYLAGAQLKPRSLKSYRRALHEYALPFFGANTPLVSIDQERFAQFIDHLRQGDKKEISTIKGYIFPVTGLFTWHRSRINNLPLLTTETLLPKQVRPDGDERDPFSIEQMGAIFLNAKKYRLVEPGKYWATVATAITGCRIEEISQINLETDLKQDHESGRWYFELNENPDRDGVVRKSLKRLSSWRVVPIHSALEDAGFLDFLREQLRAGNSRPFEGQWKAWLDKSTDGLKWSHSISKWGGRELDKLDKSKQLSREGLDLGYFHSMRHTFANALAKQRVPEEERSALQGQQYGGINADRYANLRADYRYLSGLVEANLGELVTLLK